MLACLAKLRASVLTRNDLGNTILYRVDGCVAMTPNPTLLEMAECCRKAAALLGAAHDMQERVTLAMPLDLRSLLRHLRKLAETLSAGELGSAAMLHRDFAVVDHAVWLGQAGHRKNPQRLKDIGQRGGRSRSPRKLAAVKANGSAAKKTRRSERDRARVLLSVMSTELQERGRSWTMDQFIAGKFSVRATRSIKRQLKQGLYPDVRLAIIAAGAPELAVRMRVPAQTRLSLQNRLLYRLRSLVGKDTQVTLKIIKAGIERVYGPFAAPRDIEVPVEQLDQSQVWFRTANENTYARLNMDNGVDEGAAVRSPDVSACPVDAVAAARQTNDAGSASLTVSSQRTISATLLRET